MRNGKWITVGVLGLLLTGCGAGITQEQYDEVVSANASMSEALASAQAEASSARAELYIVNSKIDNASADEGSQSDLIASLKEENESLSMAVMSLQQAAHTTPEASPEETVTASESVTEEEVAEALPEGYGQVHEINHHMFYETFYMTIKSYQVITDRDGNLALKFTFEWENQGEEPMNVNDSFLLLGYQNGVEMERGVPFSEDIDRSLTDKIVMPGGKISGEEAIFLDDPHEKVLIKVYAMFDELDMTDINDFEITNLK